MAKKSETDCKMREIVSGAEIKDLLFMTSLSHLKIVSSFHPRLEGDGNAAGGWRPVWPSPRDEPYLQEKDCINCTKCL